MESIFDLTQGNVGVVKLLLARGLDEGHRDNLGWTPLHVMIFVKHAYLSLIFVFLFQYAAFEGHREVCEALVEAGARINDVDNDGYHGLLLAAQEGHLHVVKSLINSDADLDHRSHDGQTPLRKPISYNLGFRPSGFFLILQVWQPLKVLKILFK